MLKTNHCSIAKFEQFVELKDYKPKTKKEYVRYIRRLAEHFQCDPATLSEDQLREYFLFLRTQKRFGPSAMKLAKFSLRSFFREHLKRGLDWSVFEEVRIVNNQTLPTVLARTEVATVLSHVREPRFRTCLRLIYHTGLRVNEAVHVQVRDLQDTRTAHPRLYVRLGKGGKDRYVPLHPAMVQELRLWWKQHQNKAWIFPAPGRGWALRSKLTLSQALHQSNHPMSCASVQNAFRLAHQLSGVSRPATVHTLRHSYATFLLEEGVNLRQIAQYLGHDSLDTTVLYTHLTTLSESRTRDALNTLYAQLGA